MSDHPATAGTADLLTNLLRQLHLSTRLFHRELRCGAWTLSGGLETKAMFHLVAKGQCDLFLEDESQPLRINHGDVVLFPRPLGHSLRSASSPRGAVDTLLLCGYLEFASPLAGIVLDSLPTTLVLQGRARNAGRCIAEADHGRKRARGAGTGCIDRQAGRCALHLRAEARFRGRSGSRGPSPRIAR